MGGQLDGNFLAGSLPHEFIILIVASFICLWSINFSLPLEVGPINTAKGLGSAVSSPSGSGADRKRKWNLVYLALKSDTWWHQICPFF